MQNKYSNIVDKPELPVMISQMLFFHEGLKAAAKLVIIIHFMLLYDSFYRKS